MRVAIGLALLIFLAWYYYNAPALAKQLRSLKGLWIGAAGLTILFATLLGAVNSYLFVGVNGEITIRRFIPLYWTSWALGLVIPGQVGDVVSLAAMLRRRGFQLHASLGRVLLDKAISILVIAGFAIWGIASLIGFRELGLRVFEPAIGGAVTLAAVGCWQRQRIRQFFDPGKKGLAGLIGRSTRELTNTAGRFPGRTAANFLLTVIKLMLTGLSYWAMFMALRQPALSPWQVIMLISASSLVAYLPLSFNGLGTVEITGILLFARLGVPDSSVLSAYILLRLLVLVLAWIPAALWLLSRPKSAH